MPQLLGRDARRLALRDGDLTAYGFVQAITYAADASNRDLDVCFAMEWLTGDYLAGTSASVGA